MLVRVARLVTVVVAVRVVPMGMTLFVVMMFMTDRANAYRREPRAHGRANVHPYVRVYVRPPFVSFLFFLTVAYCLMPFAFITSSTFPSSHPTALP